MASDLAQSLAFAGIDDATRGILRETWPRIRDSVPVILEATFAPMVERPATAATGSRQVEAARDAQAGHWEALFKAEFDEDYVVSLRQIGTTHARIGLDPQWLVAAHLTTLTRLHSLVVEAYSAGVMSWRMRSGLERAVVAIDRVVLFDLQLCLSAYVVEAKAVALAGTREPAWRFDRATGSRTEGLAQVAGNHRRAADALFASSQGRRPQAVAVEAVAVEVVEAKTVAVA